MLWGTILEAHNEVTGEIAPPEGAKIDWGSKLKRQSMFSTQSQSNVTH